MKQATGKDTTTAFLMMDESYKQSFGILSNLPAYAALGDKPMSVARMVTNRINNNLGNTQRDVRKPAVY